jgi:hypothetical protein
MTISTPPQTLRKTRSFESNCLQGVFQRGELPRTFPRAWSVLQHLASCDSELAQALQRFARMANPNANPNQKPNSPNQKQDQEREGQRGKQDRRDQPQRPERPEQRDERRAPGAPQRNPSDSE